MNGLKKIVIIALGVVFCAVAVIFAGCDYTVDGVTENWVRTTILENYYKSDGDYDSLGNMSGLTIDQMVEKLDRYSTFYTAEEYAKVLKDNAGKKLGTGISYAAQEDGSGLITRVAGGSSARRAGICEGLYAVGGKVGGSEIAFTSSNTFSDFVGARATGEEFTLILSDGSQKVICKEEYTASYAVMFTNSARYEADFNRGGELLEESSAQLSFLPDGAAYIRLAQFYGKCADEFGLFADKFKEKGLKDLIIDLRGDGGGYVDAMRDIAGRFTSSRGEGDFLAMTARDKGGATSRYNCGKFSKGVFPADASVYIMADDGTASASEALIGALVDNGVTTLRNVCLSETDGVAATYGKGIMQSTYPFVTGEALKLTVAGIFWPSGRSIHGVGITPADGCMTAAGEKAPYPGDGECRTVVQIYLAG